MYLPTWGHIQHMYSWWWVELSPETCRVKPLRRINAIVASCWIYFTTPKFRFVAMFSILRTLFRNYSLCLCSVLVSYFACLNKKFRNSLDRNLSGLQSPSVCLWGKTNVLLLPEVEPRCVHAPARRLVTTPTSPVFLNRRAPTRYRPLTSIIPGRERFWNLSF